MDKRLSRVWQPLAWRLGAACIAAWALGALVDRAWMCLSIVLAAALAYTLVKLNRLHRWLLSSRQLPPEEQHGIWYELHSLFRTRNRASRRRKRRLLDLVRAFREAAEALPDAMIYLGADQRIVWFNAAAEHLIGLNHPNDIGAGITHLLRSPRVVDWLEAGAAEPLFDEPAPDDERRRLGFRLIRYGDVGQQLLIVRDISQVMRLEQMRRDFVANVSHELRTPLTVLHGYLDMIEPEDAPELAPMLKEMRAQSARMAQIVEDLLMLSRLEASPGLQDERVRMDSMLNTLKREAEALSQGAHAVRVQSEFEGDLAGSTKELHSAFSNLVSNAVRYTPAGGVITVRWHRVGDTAVLDVIDTGHGISPQHLPRITERFFRVSNSRSRETGGTGLGLSIVKHVLNLHQARLDMESEPGRGSRFSCVFQASRLLPLAPVEQDAIA
jgi:two-component system phosphate regulon sensor histidine kinase PhoR